MASSAATARRTLLLVLLLLAAAANLYWWRLGRPVALPDAPDGRIACVSYTPFHQPGESALDPRAVVTPQRIDRDLRALSTRFDCVRTYSVGGGMDSVPRIAQRYGMQVLLGIWLARDPVANERELAAGIALARQYRGTVRALIVGNEVMLRGELTASALAAYIERVHRATALPVTYADVSDFWLCVPAGPRCEGFHRYIAPAVSFLTIHVLPYWEDRPVAIDDAVAHVRDVVARVRAAYPGREVLIGETGWPSAGRQRADAVPSRVNEARFVREFLAWATQAHVPYNLIEAFDQPWKRALEGTAGGYWGLFDAHYRPKFPLQGSVVEVSRWWRGPALGAALALLFTLPALVRRRWWNGTSVTALLLAGDAAGATLAAQLRYMGVAERDAFEWGVAGACTLAALATCALIAAALARWFDDSAPALALDCGATALQRHRGGGLGRWLGLARFGWLFGMALVALLLAFDARYRDFLLPLYAAPVAGFALLALAGIGARRAVALEERLLAGWVGASAAVTIAQEGWANTYALAWAALSLAFAAAVLWPDRTARRRASAAT
ncbi:MAG TPA: glycoside hydrolase family 17 [Mizugakiibacter sp.]